MGFNLKGLTLKASSFNYIVKNKYVLYLVALIALVDILGYIMKQEFSAVIFFYLVGMITYYYTKNMTVVLLSSLLATTLAHLIKNMMGLKEGMKNDEEDLEEEEEEEEGTNSLDKQAIKDKIKLQDKEAKDNKENFRANNASQIKKAILPNKKQTDKLDDVSNEASKILKNLEKKGIKSGYQNKQKLTPGLYNIPNKNQLQKQLGEADKMEAAYDNLEQVIGDNGIKSMSDSTKELVKQQNELLKGLKDITPALHEAMGAIGKIDLGGLSNMFNKTKQPE